MPNVIQILETIYEGSQHTPDAFSDDIWIDAIHQLPKIIANLTQLRDTLITDEFRDVIEAAIPIEQSDDITDFHIMNMALNDLFQEDPNEDS